MKDRLRSDLLLPSLLSESFSRNSQDALEAFAALCGILAESVHSDLLNTVLDFLPSATHCDDLGRLVKGRLARGASWGVSDGLLHRQKLAPCQVLRAHGDGLFARVDVGHFVDETSIVRAEERLEPRWQGLPASDKAFGTKLWEVLVSKGTEGGLDGEWKIRLTIPVS